eukprot:Skav214005  [mRNA]  locus=scaffold1070:212108:214956:- [translate_table: standard]
MDPAARREGKARNCGEAEANALQEPNSFVKLCREHSDCASAEQPGTLAGHMGWVARGEQEAPMEEAAFATWSNAGEGSRALFAITKIYRMEKYSGERDDRNRASVEVV